MDDIVYEVNGSWTVINSGANVDIGANPSQEETEEALEEGSTRVIDVIHTFQLEPTAFDKKTYLGHLKVRVIAACIQAG